MSDYLSVTCGCGCENRVPVDRRGTIGSCVACGNDMPVPTDALARSGDSSAPKAPASVPPATIATGFIKSSARSPFEDDPMEGAVPGLTGRFTNYAPPVHERIDESCSRCGRQLRGEWDRLQSASGVLCYVCANQGAEGTPERLKHESGVHKEPHRPLAYVDRSQIVGSLPSPLRRKFQSLALKGIIAGAAVLFFVVAYMLTVYKIEVPVFGDGWATTRSPNAAEMNSLSTLPWVLYQVWKLLVNVTPVFIGAFAAFVLTNALSRQQLLKNVYAAVSLSMPIAVVTLIGIIVLPVFGKDSARAAFLTVIVFAAQSLALVYAAFELLDESPWHCAYFVLLFTAMRVALPYLDRPLFELIRTM